MSKFRLGIVAFSSGLSLLLLAESTAEARGAGVQTFPIFPATATA